MKTQFCFYINFAATPGLQGQIAGYAGSDGFYVSSSSNSGFFGTERGITGSLALTVVHYILVKGTKKSNATWLEKVSAETFAP